MAEMSHDNLLETKDEMAKVYKQYETWVEMQMRGKNKSSKQ